LLENSIYCYNKTKDNKELVGNYNADTSSEKSLSGKEIQYKVLKE